MGSDEENKDFEKIITANTLMPLKIQASLHQFLTIRAIYQE
jgi:hypothetical protein